MKKLLDYVLSCIYLVYFGLVLCIFHLLQVIAWHGFGRPAHKKTVDWMNACIAYGWYLTGSTIQFNNRTDLPTDRPIIFVANHQSMFDISPMIWFLRRHTPLFVSKIELAHGIPGVSYNLRKSGAALIDRKDPKQAIVEIARLGKLIQQTNHSAVIFPEGTRSRVRVGHIYHASICNGGPGNFTQTGAQCTGCTRCHPGNRALQSERPISTNLIFAHVVAGAARY